LKNVNFEQVANQQSANQMVDMADDPMLISCEVDFATMTFCNRAFCCRFGVVPDAQASLSEVLQLLEMDECMREQILECPSQPSCALGETCGEWRWKTPGPHGNSFAIRATHIPGGIMLHFLDVDIHADVKLTARQGMECTVSRLISRFAEEHDLDRAITASLQDLCELRDASRAYLFRFTPDGAFMSNTHEWCAAGVVPQRERLQKLPSETFPWWMHQLRAGETIHVPDVSAMPPEAVTEKQILEMQDIKSLLVLPMLIRNRLIGFIGFDNIRGAHRWSDDDVTLLEVFSVSVANALHRVEAEAELRSQEDLTRAVMQGLPALLFRLSADAVFTLVEGGRLWENASLPRPVVGLSASEVYGSQSEFCQCVKRAMGGESFGVTIQGEGYVSDYWFSPVREHNAVAGVIGIAVDSSELRRAEMELRVSEERYRSLFHYSTDGIFIHRRDGTLVDVNAEALRQLGYVREELLNLNVQDLHPQSAAGTSQWAFEMLRQNGSVHFEIPVRRQDGTTFPAEISACVFTVGGEEYVQGIVRDISERLRAEEERASLELRLRQAEKMESIGELAGGIAHDFNNILTAIQGNAELMERFVAPNTEVAELAAEIRSATARAVTLTSQMLAFARKGQFRVIPVNIHRIISETASLLRRGLNSQIEVLCELDAAEHVVLGDPTQIESALLNLAFNARDAMPAGGEVRFRTRNIEKRGPEQDGDVELRPGRYVELEVSDTGVGMDAAVLKRIFEPFFTTKPPGKGTGLGLASVYGCVRSHQGAISVTSQPGEGAVFTIVLPVADEEEQAVEGEKYSNGQALPRFKGRIMVVDDEEMIRNLAVRAITEAGGEVVTCADGPQAILAFEQSWQQVDLVLLDLVMPKLDGSSVFREMRRINPDARILIMTGYSRSEATDQLLQEGAVGLLHKPFRINELQRMIWAQVESR
jgi:PAS domain S-box-containing protein